MRNIIFVLLFLCATKAWSQGGAKCSTCPPTGVGQSGKVLSSDGSAKATYATASSLLTGTADQVLYFSNAGSAFSDALMVRDQTTNESKIYRGYGGAGNLIGYRNDDDYFGLQFSGNWLQNAANTVFASCGVIENGGNFTSILHSISGANNSNINLTPTANIMNLLSATYQGECELTTTKSLFGWGATSTTMQEMEINTSGIHFQSDLVGNLWSIFGTGATGILSNTGATAQGYITLKAGTTTYVPIKFTSGTLATGGNILAGNFEFLTDKWYGTITTGAVQKEFTLNDAALTSGTTPVATTNGRLTDGLILASSTYTPTLTNVTNIAASTAYLCQYLRVGNTVTVSGKVDIDVTLGAASELGVSLPIASDFTAEQSLGGSASSAVATTTPVPVKADATNNRAALTFTAVSLTNDSYFFEFTYRIQ